jgi:hypothetical protein
MFETSIDRLASRHIAKCLEQLDGTLAPVQIASIKRSFRFFADDIKTHVTEGQTHDEAQIAEINGNR